MALCALLLVKGVERERALTFNSDNYPYMRYLL